MKIPLILGQPLHLWLGIVLLMLAIFQIATAKRVLPISFSWHRSIGYVLLFLAIIHGSIAIGLRSGIFSL